MTRDAGGYGFTVVSPGDPVALSSLAATRALAARLATLLPAGSLLLLAGELGAGKTTLTQALAEALGSPARVSSPTYTLIHEYPTPEGLLVHIDAYRLPSAEALLELGLEDYLGRARLVVVEWGEGLLAHYPDACLLRLELTPEGRRATLEGLKLKIEG
ncbi:MAG: tRNA (adenosine(37)-N6)-threonylcarbamoyltransferase complex ATPase subunit type 1 TsaE [Deinococcota bacterium]|jgi:tRNA threonylcarbamoyladenosine biosynthesis protein TsaE|nr:tRNA (adenosine(37)-N6)-threonylcarbamoyltransferase complex ATPase subunit type 1 TsaE [Deinococcota bacterium]